MEIDFSPIQQGEMKMLEFAGQFAVDDLRAATRTSIDLLLDIIRDLDDKDVIFDPDDPEANDPFAASEEERYIAWNIAHLIAHVTASSEEGAAFSSLLARGIAPTERPRYETPWRDITTKAQCGQRLEESRRMRLGYLDTWPDQPFLAVFRPMSDEFVERYGQINAPGAFLFGLMHEVGHYDQIKAVKQQAIAARK